MEIICPECQFSRSVPDAKVPPTAEMATCPKCGIRFRFRVLEEPAQDFMVHHDDAAPAPAPEAVAARSGVPEAAGPAAPRLPYEQDEPVAERRQQPEQGDVFAGLEAMAGERETPRRPSFEQAYNEDGARGHGDDSAGPRPTVEVPWEDLERWGFFQGLFQTVKRGMLQPSRFFAAMPLRRGYLRPLAFYVLISEISAVVLFIYQTMGLDMLTQTQDGGELLDAGGFIGMGAASALMLLFYPILFTIMLYAMAAVHHLFLTLFQAARGGFEGTFRAVAYGSAPTVLSVVPILGWLVAGIWTLVVTVIGLKQIHDTTYGRVLAALSAQILAFLLLIGFAVYLLHGMAA